MESKLKTNFEAHLFCLLRNWERIKFTPFSVTGATFGSLYGHIKPPTIGRREKCPENFSRISLNPSFNAKTRKMWTFIFGALPLLPVLFLLTSKNFKKKLKVFRISFMAAFDFIFRMTSEDRLKAFRKIHRLFPKFLHIDFLNLKVLFVYDPEIARR